MRYVIGLYGPFNKTPTHRVYYTHRKDPVPFSGWGNKSSGRGCYRKVHTAQEKRSSFDLETRHLIRLKRRNMRVSERTTWWSEWNHNCWKKCTKKKRQWM